MFSNGAVDKLNQMSSQFAAEEGKKKREAERKLAEQMMSDDELLSELAWEEFDHQSRLRKADADLDLDLALLEGGLY